MSKKKKVNRDILKKQDYVSLKELENKGLVPKNFHLYDGVDMKEWQKINPGYKEWERGLKQNEYPPSFYLIKRKPEFARNGVIVKQNQKNKGFSEATAFKNIIPPSSKLKLNDIIYVYSKDFGIYAKGKVTSFGEIKYFKSIEEILAHVKNNKLKDYAYWFKLISKFSEAKSRMETEQLIYHEYKVNLKLLQNSIAAENDEIKHLKNVQRGFYKLKEKDINKINHLIENPVSYKVNRLSKVIPGKLRQDLYSLFNKKYNLSIWIDIDHFVPQSVGGPGNIIQNLVPMGLSLNRYKSDKIPTGLFFVASNYQELKKITENIYLEMHTKSPTFLSIKDVLTVKNDAEKIIRIVNNWEIEKATKFYGQILKEHHPKYYELIETFKQDIK